METLSHLRASILLTSAGNILVVLMVSTLFEGTTGFCDENAASSRDVYRFVALFQILLTIPSLLFYHRADKESAESDSCGHIPQSFIFFTSGFFLAMYITLRTVLLGPFEDMILVLLLMMFAILVAFSMAGIQCYSNRHTIAFN